jgi:hypothetical protein
MGRDLRREDSKREVTMGWKYFQKDNMRIVTHGKSELIIACHGGHTPPRLGGLRKGSGTWEVPAGVGILFYCEHDDFSKHSNPNSLYFGSALVTPVGPKVLGPGHSVTNYSLTCKQTYLQLARAKPPLPGQDYQMDLFVFTDDTKKAHLSDVWNFALENGLRYKTIHYCACRVDKTKG